jgi:hypothetical protein
MEKIDLIDRLQLLIDSDRDYNPDADFASMGYECGVLLTRNEALRIIELLNDCNQP